MVTSLQIVLVKICQHFAQRWFKYQQSKLFSQFGPTKAKLIKHWAIIYSITHQKSVSWANFMQHWFNIAQ